MIVTRADLYGRINGWFKNKELSLIENIKYSIDIDIRNATRPPEYYKMYLVPSRNKEIYERELQHIEKVFAERKKDLKEFCKENPELEKQIKELKGLFKQRAEDRYVFTDYCSQIVEDNKALRNDIPDSPLATIDRLFKEEYNPYLSEGYMRFEGMKANLDLRLIEREVKLERHKRQAERLAKMGGGNDKKGKINDDPELKKILDEIMQSKPAPQERSDDKANNHNRAEMRMSKRSPERDDGR